MVLGFRVQVFRVAFSDPAFVVFGDFLEVYGILYARGSLESSILPYEFAGPKTKK